MTISLDTQTRIELLDKIFTDRVYNYSYDNLDRLYNKSKLIIKNIIKNLNVKIIDKKTIKHSCNDLIVHLIKNINSDTISNKNIKRFVNRVKNKSLDNKNIQLFLRRRSLLVIWCLYRIEADTI